MKCVTVIARTKREEDTDLSRYRTGEIVVFNHKRTKKAKLTYFCGNGACQKVHVNAENIKVNQISNLGRNSSGEKVASDFQNCEVCK